MKIRLRPQSLGGPRDDQSFASFDARYPVEMRATVWLSDAEAAEFARAFACGDPVELADASSVLPPCGASGPHDPGARGTPPRRTAAPPQRP